jgi:DNA invertase Pin-like site-specific DNA recombinase
MQQSSASLGRAEGAAIRASRVTLFAHFGGGEVLHLEDGGLFPCKATRNVRRYTASWTCSQLETSMTTSRNLCAAQYIRMSTDHQDLSPDMQKAAIDAYASRNGLSVIRTFLDAGRSGLTLRKRPAMKQLLQEVTNPQRSFSVVLVYDISRWGRFQDTDASAYYEYHCRLHGVDVRYVQEPFSGADSALATLFKGMKRAMAAEFSRELAMKTTAGQTAAISKGFQLGKLPCLGIDRIAVSKADGSERPLSYTEHKAGHREHVKWVSGPEHERRAVLRIFELYAKTEVSVVDLARQLEAEGVRTRGGRVVSEWMLYSFLRSETVLGNFVWGRAENKKRRAEGDQRVRRVSGCMEPIVPREIFDAVQAKLARRKHVILTKETLLEQLRTALVANPRLRGSQLKAHGCPCRESYIKQFGSLGAAWAAAGAAYPCAADARQNAEMVHSAQAGALMCARIAAALSAAGVDCRRHTRADRGGQTLLINAATILRVQVIWKQPRYDGLQWSLRKIYKAPFDWILVVRLRDDDTALDSILFTRGQYFAHDKWLQDELTGCWRTYRNAAELATKLNSLDRQTPTPAAAPRHGP